MLTWSKDPLVSDGTGKYLDTCNFCGRVDLIFPTSSLKLCPDCFKKGDWRVTPVSEKEVWKAGIPYPIKVPYVGRIEGYRNPYYRGRFVLLSDGVCSLCGTVFIGAGARVEGWACFKCLWTRIAKRHGALRVDGFRVV